MSGATCPACGVVVMAGYVRCPKCKQALPHRPPLSVEGGTAVEQRSKVASIAWIAAALLVVGASAAYVALREPPARPAPANATTTTPAASRPTEPAPVAAPIAQPTEAPRADAQPPAPNAAEVAAQLEKSLKRQRLWSTVTVTDARIEIRSSSCADPAMASQLERSIEALRAAGLTRLRCVEQSGRVVIDREL